jgi:hypothetical protein
MNSITENLGILITRELNTFITEIEMFPDDESVWKTVPGISNSVGNLALHVCGNLQHFIGTVLGNSDYVRNREAEFNATSGSKAELINEITKTIDVIKQVLPKLTDDQLKSIYPIKFDDFKIPTNRFLIHLSIHLGMHLGQAGCLRRTLTKNNTSTSPLPLNFIKY